MSSSCECVCNQTQTVSTNLIEVLLTIALILIIWSVLLKQFASPGHRDLLILTNLKEAESIEHISMSTKSSTTNPVSLDRNNVIDDKRIERKKDFVAQCDNETDTLSMTGCDNKYEQSNDTNESYTDISEISVDMATEPVDSQAKSKVCKSVRFCLPICALNENEMMKHHCTVMDSTSNRVYGLYEGNEKLGDDCSDDLDGMADMDVYYAYFDVDGDWSAEEDLDDDSGCIR